MAMVVKAGNGQATLGRRGLEESGPWEPDGIEELVGPGGGHQPRHKDGQLASLFALPVLLYPA